MSGKKGCKYGEEIELRRGPWTLEEDNLLIHYIACHGEGRWNLLARCSGLKRTGKSCRLRWLNYLKPDVKRGNLAPEEQILILELHARWGNRWSRIAQHLPGRTDNEIKNYWRTRVQKQARQLKIDANSTLFRDAVRCFWMPRLIEKMGTSTQVESTNQVVNPHSQIPQPMMSSESQIPITTRSTFDDNTFYIDLPFNSCSPSISSDAMAIPQWPTTSQFTSNPPIYQDQMEMDTTPYNPLNYDFTVVSGGLENQELLPIERSQQGVGSNSISECSAMDNYCMNNNNNTNTIGEGLWSMDELWQVRKLHEWGIQS